MSIEPYHDLATQQQCRSVEYPRLLYTTLNSPLCPPQLDPVLPWGIRTERELQGDEAGQRTRRDRLFAAPPLRHWTYYRQVTL